MKTFAIVGAVIIAIVVIGLASIWGTYTGWYKYGTQQEALIDAAYKDNQNVLSAFKLKVKDALSTSKLNAQQVEAVTEAAGRARYGADGSKAMMQWIQENNIQLDQSINRQLVQLIEIGRNDFKVAQTNLLDKVRSYQTRVDQKYFFGAGWWLSAAGFPTSKYQPDKYRPITDADTDKAYASGKDEPIDFGLKN